MAKERQERWVFAPRHRKKGWKNQYKNNSTIRIQW